MLLLGACIHHHRVSQAKHHRATRRWMNQRYSFFQLFHLVILSICCVICRIYNIDSLFFFLPLRIELDELFGLFYQRSFTGAYVYVCVHSFKRYNWRHCLVFFFVFFLCRVSSCAPMDVYSWASISKNCHWGVHASAVFPISIRTTSMQQDRGRNKKYRKTKVVSTPLVGCLFVFFSLFRCPKNEIIIRRRK